MVGVGAWALSLTTGDAPDDVVVSGVGPQPTQLVGANKCVVSYAVWSDDGSRFKAAVTLANRDVKAIKNWKLWFLMPGDQVVSGNGKLALDQQNRAVTVQAKTALDPQATQTMQFTGRYEASNSAPMVFQLDGQTCETFVSPKPGEPSRPVEHLTNGQVRLGPVPNRQNPLPGTSVDPSGVIVPVPVESADPGASKPVATTPGTPIATTTTGGTGTGGTGGNPDDEPAPGVPPETTTPATTPATSETPSRDPSPPPSFNNGDEEEPQSPGGFG
ncbi:cellulose-binding domain-containing protein [Couchioplanes caeruleus]|nr:cellulose binding domain-containing protein [Couchioplanes caeruleus]UQU68508.1 cellulose-binding domain-containing protein [Couchioplanes caeruleus]